ncbi:hypothetical protein BaRGS_00008483 [Batillaria attramentaria]|uniref:CUB domain-containing protein n=1 Tax=Batillaria attramentaria TaxID=370345 RepID=A0ABD0LLA6_9CAEN
MANDFVFQIDLLSRCGERITMRESGNITFNPTSNGHDYYDCIWVIQKEPHYEKIMVKVVNFSTRETTYRVNQPNILEIRDGLTSRGILRANAVPSRSPDDIQTYYPHDSDVGFYVRLKGHYSGRRDFVLVYTSFNYGHNRRRGPRGGTGGGSHDLPPSYEEVLSTTPIGYLNLGFADGIPASEISLIQPPSYEEATSPTESAPPFSLTASHSHDLSSDSSSLETVNRSHHHLSISDSSDDSQAGREQRRHQHRRNMSSSSSDSSVELRFEVEGQGSGGGRGEGGVNSQGDGLERPNTRHSIAKPDEGNSTESAVSTTNNLTNKDGQQKPENGTQPPRGKRNKRNNSTTPTIITQDLSPAAVAVPTRVRDSGDRGPSNRSSREIMCRLEESPVVLAPAFLGAAQQRRPAPDAALSRPSAHAGRQGASQGRPAEQTAPHVRRDPRTHKPQHTPMKLLSRSMDDVRMHVEDCPGQSFPSSRPFSQSVENICEWSGDSAGGDPHRHAPVDLAQSRPYQSRESPPRRSGSGNDSRHADGRQYRQEMPSVGENRPRPVPRPRKLLEGTGQNANSRHRDSHERESSHPSTRQLSQSSSPPHVTHSLDRSVQRPDVSHEPQSRAAPHRNTASLDRHVNPEQWGSRSPSRSERQTSHCDPDAAASPSKREKQSMPGASPKPYGDSDNAQRMRQYDARDRSERYSDKDQSSRNNDRKEDWSSVSTVPGQHGSDSGRRQKTPIPSQISQALNQPGAGWDRSSAAPNSAWARLKPGGERSRPAEPPTTPQVHSPPRVNSAQAKHAPVHPASGQSRSRGETEVGAEHQSHGSDTSGLPASPRHQDPVVQDSAEMPSSSPVRIVGSYGMNNPVMYSLQLAGGEEDDVYV